MSNIKLIAVHGIRQSDLFSFPLLKHWFGHYRDCGVRPSDMYITLSASEADDPDPVKKWIEDFGATVVKIWRQESFDFYQVTEERQRLQRWAGFKLDDWFINPDADELIAFEEPVPELVAWMEKNGFNHLDGDMMDCFDLNLKLKAVRDDFPLHLQFPREVGFSHQRVGCNPRKVVLAKNCFQIEIGCHWLGNRSKTPFSYASRRLKINHYKWHEGLRTRTEKVREFAYRLNVPWKLEYDYLLKCIETRPDGDYLRLDVLKDE